MNGVALLGTLVGTLGNELGVVGGSLLGGSSLCHLDGKTVALALECDGGDEALDLGSLPLALAAFLLRGDLAVDDKLADIVVLGEVEELADLAGALRAEAAGHSRVSQPGDRSLARLGDDEGKGGNVGADNAATHRLAAALTVTAGTVARMASGEKEASTPSKQDTLLHGEALLVVTTGNLEHIALPLITESVSLNFLSHTLIVENAATEKNTSVSLQSNPQAKVQLDLIDDLEELLKTGSRVGNIELHNNQYSCPHKISNKESWNMDQKARFWDGW